MLRVEKPKEVEKMKKLIDDHKVIGIIDLHKMPNRQLQKIKQKLKSMAMIKVSKKIIITKAIEKSEKNGINDLKATIGREPAIIFSNENPFKLFAALKKNEIPAGAKSGDIALDDIIVKEGSTGIPPGPAITSLQKIDPKIKTSVQDGKIHIMQELVAVKKGEVITGDQANGFNMLKMEPMKIRLSLKSALEEGTVYLSDILDIDDKEFENNIERSIVEALNLSVNIGYATKDNIELLIQKCFSDAKNLSMEIGLVNENTIELLISKASTEAKSLEGLIDIKPVEDVKKENDSEGDKE